MSSTEALAPPRDDIRAVVPGKRLLANATVLEALAVCAVLAVAVLVRAYAIGSKGMWLDEAFSMFMARQPLPQMFELLIAHDTAPPLYYTLLHIWLGLGGDTTTSARLLSALLGVLAVLGGYGIGREVGGHRVGMAAAVLLAVSPFQVWYGQEARMYALLAALCAASTLLLLQAIKRGGFWRWAGYVVTTDLALYTHAVVPPFVVAEIVAILVFVRLGGAPPRRLRPWLASMCTVALLWLPWLPGFLRQSMTYQTFWITNPTPDELRTLVFEMTSAYLPHWRVPHGEDILVAAGLLLAGMFAFRRLPRAEYGYLLTLAVLPVVLVYLISQFRPIFISRVVIYVGVPYLVLLAAGLVGVLPRWRAGLILLGALVSLNVVSLIRLYDVIPKEEWRAAAHQVATQATPGELVLFDASDTQIAFDYYAADEAKPLEEHGLPFDVLSVGPLEPSMRQADPARFHELVNGHASFWLVESHDTVADPAGLARAWANSVSTLVDTQQYTGVTVYHYATSARASRNTGGSN